MEQRFCCTISIFMPSPYVAEYGLSSTAMVAWHKDPFLSRRNKGTLVSPNSLHFHTILLYMADESFVLVGTPFPQIKKTDAFGDPKRPNPTRDLEVRHYIRSNSCMHQM